MRDREARAWVTPAFPRARGGDSVGLGQSMDQPGETCAARGLSSLSNRVGKTVSNTTSSSSHLQLGKALSDAIADSKSFLESVVEGERRKKRYLNLDSASVISNTVCVREREKLKTKRDYRVCRRTVMKGNHEL